MNIVKREIDQLNATITIQVTTADYAERVEKKLRDFRKKANIPGFRPGMVPMGMIKKMYGKAVLGEEVNSILSESLYNYIREENLSILGEPLPNETEQKEIDFDTQDTYEFVFDIATAPEFEVNLSAKNKVKYYEIEVTQEEIDTQVSQYAQRYGKYLQVDMVELNDVVKGNIAEVGGNIAKQEVSLTAAYMKDDAQKALFVGAKKGDIITFNPKLAYDNESEFASLVGKTKEEVAGNTSDFTLEITAITRYEASEVNQELFDKVYGEGVVADKEAFVAKITEEMRANLTQDANYKFGLDAKTLVLGKMADLTFPDAFLKRWLLATNEKMTQEGLDTDYPRMIEDLKWHLAKEKLAKKYEVKVENTDVEAYARNIAKMQFAQYGLTGIDDAILDNYAKDMLKKEDQLKGIIDRIVEEKITNAIKEVVKLDTTPISKEDFNKLFEA